MLRIKFLKELELCLRREIILKKIVCKTCTIPIYFHISFTALKCWVMRPIVTYFPSFNTDKNYSVNHILETFSSYRTYIQIIQYSSTQQSLLSQNLTFNV